MDGVTLLREARDAGLRVEVRGGKLIVQGPRRSEEIAKRLLAAKPDVLCALEAAVDWRVGVMRTQITTTGAVPLLVARPGVEFKPGTCCSCGEDFGPADRYRCAACVAAAVAVLAETR